jgi:sulfur carrier protein ThiS adenylyltransferase
VVEIDIFAKNPPEFKTRLSGVIVGIAGAGGLGSNIAVALVRAGVGTLVICDFDLVEPSNLNRQYYFFDDIGKPKVSALASHLKAINPLVVIIEHQVELNPQNLSDFYYNADLLMEAFDKAESKAWLIETWLSAFPERPVICGNGMGGYGRTDLLKVKREQNLILCGDGSSGMEMGLCSSRVAIVANMQANEAIEYLLKK